MKTPFLLIAPMFALLAVTGAAAQTPPGEQPVKPYVQSDANASAKPFEGDHMFKALHGLEGIDRIVTQMMDENSNDPRTADIFRAEDKARLHRTLVEQFCYLAGGPCHYTGMSMKQAHEHMGVQTKDFDALVEHLEHAMAKEGVPFRDQAKLLGKFAPMKRIIVDEDRG
jgi:hemoglobin